MRIPILIEPTPERRYRAIGGEPFVGAVEADTPTAAIEKMKELIDRRLAEGGRLAAIELPCEGNPWLEGAGMFRDDPLFEDWQRAVENHRRERNQNDDAP